MKSVKMDIIRFKREYENERDQLKSLCNKWQSILDNNLKKIHNDDVKGAIMSVIGQTRLLLNQKLQQFEKLLVDTEQQWGEGEGVEGDPQHKQTVTLTDIEGFWELVMIQVNDVHTKFANLEDLDLYTTEPTRPSSNQRKLKPQSKYHGQ